jgi:hypothetical protein
MGEERALEHICHTAQSPKGSGSGELAIGRWHVSLCVDEAQLGARHIEPPTQLLAAPKQRRGHTRCGKPRGAARQTKEVSVHRGHRSQSTDPHDESRLYVISAHRHGFQLGAQFSSTAPVRTLSPAS